MSVPTRAEILSDYRAVAPWQSKPIHAAQRKLLRQLGERRRLRLLTRGEAAHLTAAIRRRLERSTA